MAFTRRFLGMDPTTPTSPFDIDQFLKTLTQRPGVYRMLDEKGEVIYVGKAKNLKKRVSSYFSGRETSPKQQAMVSRIHTIDVRVTHTEAEALLLESQLIKQHRPRYNITLRDDKSYPAIYVSTQKTFPQLAFHRGTRQREGRYFGPYPSASAVRESLKLLKKVFPVRQCRDSFFAQRSRPCLEYQIKRCSGPCVGLVSEADYAADVSDTLMFLEGDGNRLIDQLAIRMEKAASTLDFEKAARYRDQIATLRTVLQKQAVHGEQGDLDLIACALRGASSCIQLVFIRGGQQIGDRTYFPSMHQEHDKGQILSAFITQFYLGKAIPREILLSDDMEERELIETTLEKEAGHPVRIASKLRGERARRMELAKTNAEIALSTHLAQRQTLDARFKALGEVLGCPSTPARIECFDISHTQGKKTVASCVVFNQSGPVKASYRRFNIEGIEPGDDYAALAQAVGRRYNRVKKGEYICPDLLLIDGGKGQLSAVMKALASLEMSDVRVFGVSKGPDRKAGMEHIVPSGNQPPFMLPPNSAALLLIQQIRDEAHRFAITGHRQRRSKAQTESKLDGIEGLGPKRRQQLLRQFGGIREISRASVDTLASVNGISIEMAQRIYQTFHQQDA